MENSFFEYRDKTGVNSGSDVDSNNESFVIDHSFCSKKKKNHSVFIAESEESSSEDETQGDMDDQCTSSIGLKSSIENTHVVLSSDDDCCQRENFKKQMAISKNKLISSSSCEEDQQLSPELVPRRPPVTPKSAKVIERNSYIKNKRVLIDSDLDNSLVVEHKRNRKIVCRKETPLKIARRNTLESKSDQKHITGKEANMSTNKSDIDDGSATDDSHDSDDYNITEDKSVSSCTNQEFKIANETLVNSKNFLDSNSETVLVDSDDELVLKTTKKMNKNRRVISDDDDDGPDEDEMVMSRATRMSIMGVIPKVNDSDESDFIESGDSHRKSSEGGSTDSLSELPDVGIETHNEKTPTKIRQSILESSRLTCSPIVSPSNDINDDNDIMDLTKNSPSGKDNVITYAAINGEAMSQQKTIRRNENFIKYDDDVTIVDIKPEIIDLSSDSEDEKLIDHMDFENLPDGGLLLRERLKNLEDEVHRQGEKVANMVEEPDNPTAYDIARDGFEKGLSWDDIQRASNAVQPRMFGKQAMATHMAEKNLILERLRDLHMALESRPPESEVAAPPRGLATELMPHQLHALAWLRWRETQRPTAGILADDMGLGKTITMIALVVSDKENRYDDQDSDEELLPSKSNKLVRGGTLVVCPASLMQQWAGEVMKHCAPHCLSVCQHHGPSRSTQPHRLSSHDLVLTTYNILQRDNEKNGVLMRVRWRRVILDEAHVVRNHKSATSTAVSALAASRRWCLTGTPVQNKDLDLFALLKFLRCSPFDELTMWKKWIDNKSLGGQERLNTIMQCILLRRTKQQLQQRGQLDCLPDRTSHQKEVTLTKAEMNVYQKVLVFSKTLFAQFLHQRAEKNADSMRHLPPDKDSEYTKMHKKMIALQGAKPVKSHEILVLLLRLRQVCCHCGLIAAMLDDDDGSGEVFEDPGGKDLLAELNKLSLDDGNSRRKNKTNDSEDEENAVEEGTTVTEAIRSVLSPNNPVFSLNKPSSKIEAVMDCLKDNVFSKKGEKAVVVSQWTSVLKLVERELTQLKVRSVTLSGVVPVPSRPALIQQINDPGSDVTVLLLSLCAGGVGLNLCGANHLLLLDPHWNPQLEEQAQDRIYRVGQKKSVHIYRFMCVDTVEQTIRKLQEAKLELAANVLTGARNTNASKLTIEDLKMLFNMGQQHQ